MALRRVPIATAGRGGNDCYASTYCRGEALINTRAVAGSRWGRCTNNRGTRACTSFHKRRPAACFSWTYWSAFKLSDVVRYSVRTAA